ncbi:hypothetical protein ST47_g3677 [Ascochyta rabiei]|uniref:Uncharacterized protein n=2 Tax=Didymella rabiei TaxID=5454 RepID=A0A163H5J9_DIDRA|nr:hypothetical protein ST47_g3677 [Ascochyta rabiei]
MLTSQTDVMSATLSSHQKQTGENQTVFYYYGPGDVTWSSNADPLDSYTRVIYGGVHKQDDPVGQYLAERAIARSLETSSSEQHSHHTNGHAGHETQSQMCRNICDSHAYEYTPLQRTILHFPDPEHIRHLHTLRSLLPHIQPERKLSALSGPEIDILDGGTGNCFCRAVPKKMLVLFLGRAVVCKFLATVQREDNENWRGRPTQQKMVLPYGVASQAAVKILVSWMTRACTFATMSTMKPIRIPSNLFAACSLAQTLELFGLHKDAYGMDLVISQHLFERPIYPVEVETLWTCLGDQNKYVYGCIRSFSQQLRSRLANATEDLERLRIKHPCLYARIQDPTLNKMYRPGFGRQWFAATGLRGGGDVKAEDDDSTTSIFGDPTTRRVQVPDVSGASASATSIFGGPTSPVATQQQQLQVGQIANQNASDYPSTPQSPPSHT